MGFLAFATALGTGIPSIISSLIAVSLTTIGISAYDLIVLRVHQRESAGLRQLRPHGPFRIVTKIVGLAVTFLIVLRLTRFLIPFAPISASRILFFYPAAFTLILLFAPAYILWTDRRMDQPEDGAFQMGKLVMGAWRGRDWQSLVDFALGWVIKAYYLPLMFGALLSVGIGLERLASDLPETFVGVYFGLFKLLLFIDLMVATIGYTMMFRVLDTHIRSCNPLFWGWFFTIGCYAPFWGYVAPYLFDHSDGMGWNNWTEGNTVLVFATGFLVLMLRASWVFSNCCFGIRFSNLTHRGILTEGAFRWTKHPSYVTKKHWLLDRWHAVLERAGVGSGPKRESGLDWRQRGLRHSRACGGKAFV